MSSKTKQWFNVGTISVAYVKKILFLVTRKYISTKTASKFLQRNEHELSTRLSHVIAAFMQEKFSEVEDLAEPWPEDRMHPTKENFEKIAYALDEYGEYPEDIRPEWRRMFEEGFKKFQKEDQG